MAFNTDKLSYFHSFSKMPVQSGSNFADGTSLGNAINKSGHTVTASEVWASDIPYYGAMGSLDDIKSKVQPYARKNDMCLVTTTGMTYIYDGAGNWSLVNADDATNKGKLVAGQLIKNSKDEVVLLYHKGETLTNLTAANNANTNSANNAARLWTTVGVDGKPCDSRLVEQFVGPTDKALNGLASVSYSPSIANGTLVAGTNYYDYCFSGTILWATARTTATVIDCFEYVGEKVSDVVDTVSAHSATIKTHGDEISELKDKLGLSTDTPDGTPTLGGRVTDNETALRVLLGLEDGDKVVATESIATTAANAVSTGLATGGNIATAIATAKQEALDAINAIQHFSVVVVPEGQKITDVNPLVENTIYLVKEEGVAEGTYIEYIAYKQGETVVTEKIGSTAIDLSGYTTDAEYEALAARVTALDAATTGRVAVVEGKVSAIETTTIPDAIETAKGYTDTKIATELAEGGSIASAINTAKEQAIASAEVTITAGTGIVVTPEGKGTTFQIAVSDDVATAASVEELSGTVSALSQVVASNMTELQGKITETQTTLQGSIDGVAGRVTDIETDLETGATAQAIAKAQGDATKALADAATASGAVTALSDTAVASQSVAGAGITVTLAGKVGAPTLTGSVATASYTAATEDAAGSWANESNVVTGATVKAALYDVATAHQKDIDTVTTAITALSTSGFQRIVVDELPTSGIQLNAIYLVPFTTAEKDENVYAEYIYVGGTVTDGVVSGGSFEQIGTTKTDLAEYAKSADIEALDATETVNGLTVTQVDGKITGLTETLITASVPEGTTSVEGNVAYVGSTKHVIAPEKFQDVDASRIEDPMPSTLTSWVADLPNLTDGCRMFSNCNALTTFIGDLGLLINGDRMFENTSLSLESVECIADTISEFTFVGDWNPSHGYMKITWKTLPEASERQAFVDMLSLIVDKNWELHTNNELLPLFDSEKYKTGSDYVQPKTRDINAEPETVYYVRKK